MVEVIEADDGSGIVKVIDVGAVSGGPSGVGVPAGGATNQVLAKNSATDYDTKWATPSGGGGGTVTTADTTSVDFSGDGSAGNPLSAVIPNLGVTNALIGPIAVSTGKVSDNAITNVKMSDIAVNTIKGRITTGTGDPEDLTATQAATVLASGSGGGTINFLRADGTWSLPPGGSAPGTVPNTATFTYTGLASTFTVPTGITTLGVTAVGAAGGAGVNGATTAAGGKGATVTANITVTPGEVLQVNVGGMPSPTWGTAFVGGGAGNGGAGDYGGGGGGASDVRRGAYALADRIVVAGAGGGGSDQGGAGGDSGLNGQPGAPNGQGSAGGGTQTAGGAGGTFSGGAGSLGQGGTANSNGPGQRSGGGGGGYYGGGGGGGWSGGQSAGSGGSSLVPSGGTVVANNTGDGSIILSWTGGSQSWLVADPMWDAKGDLAAATGDNVGTRLPVGTANQVLTVDSSTTTGLKWATSKTVANDILWDTKGDLAAATGSDAASKLPVGTNNQVLTADSTQATGLKWATPTAGVIPYTLVSTKTSSYTANVNEYIPVDATSSAVGITLPTAPANGTRVAVDIIVNPSGNNVTVTRGGTDVLGNPAGSTQFRIMTVAAQKWRGTYFSGCWYEDVRNGYNSAANTPVLTTATLTSTNVQAALQELDGDIQTGTFPGVVTGTAFSSTGLTGATSGARFVGATVSGPPTTGTFIVGDWIIDRSGQQWICTVAGSPGTWSAPGSGRELAYAEVTADQSISAIGVASRVDLTGLSITFTPSSRPVMIQLWTRYVYHSAPANAVGFNYAICDSSNAIVADCGATGPNSAAVPIPIGSPMKRLASLTPGTPVTYKGMGYCVTAATVTFKASVSGPAFIRAWEV